MKLRLLRAGALAGVAGSCAALSAPAWADTPGRVKPRIDWAAAKEAMQASDYRERSNNGGLSRDEARKVALPVLLIDHAKVPAVARFKHQVHSYAAHYPVDGASLTVFGLASPLAINSSAFEARPATAAPARYKFESTRDSSDLSFGRFGAFYTIRISCLKPADGRCTAPAFMSELADKLAVAGGQQL